MNHELMKIDFKIFIKEHKNNIFIWCVLSHLYMCAYACYILLSNFLCFIILQLLCLRTAIALCLKPIQLSVSEIIFSAFLLNSTIFPYHFESCHCSSSVSKSFYISQSISSAFRIWLIEFLFEKRCIQDWFLSEVLQIFYKWTDYFGGRKTKNIKTFSVHGSNMGLGIFIFWFSLASNSLTFFLNQHYHWSRFICFQARVSERKKHS